MSSLHVGTESITNISVSIWYALQVDSSIHVVTH